MRSRTVPIRIALAYADKRAFAHVQRDDTFLSSPGRDGSLADEVIITDVVVDAFKLESGVLSFGYSLCNP